MLSWLERPLAGMLLAIVVIVAWSMNRKPVLPSTSARQRCMLSDQDSDMLLKTRLPTFTDEYKHDDIEHVVKHYCAYLTACAEHTTRLSKTQVAASAMKLFGLNPTTANMFGDAMKSAMSACWMKHVKKTTGDRMSSAVRLVTSGSAFASSSSSDFRRSPSQETPSRKASSLPIIDIDGPPCTKAAEDLESKDSILALYGVAVSSGPGPSCGHQNSIATAEDVVEIEDSQPDVGDDSDRRAPIQELSSPAGLPRQESSSSGAPPQEPIAYMHVSIMLTCSRHIRILCMVCFKPCGCVCPMWFWRVHRCVLVYVTRRQLHGAI